MKKGFTIIELMVVIGIVTLLTAGSIYALSSGRDRRNAKTTAEKIKSVIEQAVSMAQHPNDSEFDLERIEIRFYKQDPNEVLGIQIKSVQVWRRYQNGSYVEEKKLYFKIPNSIEMTIPWGTLTTSKDGKYYYFSVLAKDIVSGNKIIGQIGQIGSLEVADIGLISINILGGSYLYQITVYTDSGTITVK